MAWTARATADGWINQGSRAMAVAEAVAAAVTVTVAVERLSHAEPVTVRATRCSTAVMMPRLSLTRRRSEPDQSLEAAAVAEAAIMEKIVAAAAVVVGGSPASSRGNAGNKQTRGTAD